MPSLGARARGFLLASPVEALFVCGESDLRLLRNRDNIGRRLGFLGRVIDGVDPRACAQKEATAWGRG